MDGADRCRSSARRFDPLRKVIVYLAPLRSVAAHWNAPFDKTRLGKYSCGRNFLEHGGVAAASREKFHGSVLYAMSSESFLGLP